MKPKTIWTITYSIKRAITELLFVWFLCSNINTDKKWSNEKKAQILPYYQTSVYFAEILYGEPSPSSPPPWILC